LISSCGEARRRDVRETPSDTVGLVAAVRGKAVGGRLLLAVADQIEPGA
jgi:hypothetical protein